MKDSTPFDLQLADMVWMLLTALRAGYSLQQVFEQLASEAPEPTSSVSALIVTDLTRGITLDQALLNWQQSVPSCCLVDVVSAIIEVKQTGGNMPDKLDPVGTDILRKVGTDKKLWPAMRALAQGVHAVLPQRMLEH